LIDVVLFIISADKSSVLYVYTVHLIIVYAYLMSKGHCCTLLMKIFVFFTHQ